MDLGEIKVLEFRAAVFRLYLMIAIVASAIVIPTYYFVGIDLLFGICIGFAVVSIATAWMFHRGIINLVFGTRLYLCGLVVSCMAGLFLGNELLDNKPWQLLLPLALFTLLGAREARVWCVACIGLAITILWSRSGAYDHTSSAVFVVAYATLAVAMDAFTRFNEQNIRTIAQLSHTDPLTGVFNRQMFDEVSRNEFNRSRRAEEPLTLYMIDIDHFKRFNDRYGHVAGDHALVDVAHVLRTTARRASDHVFRYGGEEFCIVSSGAGSAEAQIMADNLAAGVRELGIKHAFGEGGRLTVSVGLAHRQDLRDDTIDTMLRNADAALYEAKARGRDCVVASPFDAAKAPTFLSAEA